MEQCATFYFGKHEAVCHILFRERWSNLPHSISGTPPAFTKRDYVVRVLAAIDNIAQRYNRSLHPDRVAGTLVALTQVPGFVQTIIAPRPWVMMQIIHMREQPNIWSAFRIIPPMPSAHRRFWGDGIRIAYADLALLRRPTVATEQFFERVAAFWQYLDSRNIRFSSRIALTQVPSTLAALIAAAGIEAEPPWFGPPWFGQTPSITGPRNELIFEAMKHVANAN